MTKVTEKTKRDFITQLIVLVEQNADLLTAQGFDPANKLNALKQLNTEVEAAEAAQQEAAAKAKDATILANEKLSAAYKAASETVELMAGLLGKDNNLVLETLWRESYSRAH